LRTLLAKIKESDYFALKERYEYAVTDNPTRIPSVIFEKNTHQDSVYAPGELAENTEVKRFFFNVWSALMRKVPSPNPEQQPELCKP
jgi:hypothetical protein